MVVKDVMTREVVTVSPSASLKEAAELLVRHGISGLPVVEEHRVVGVISERDFLIKEQGPPDPSRWPAWLTTPLAVTDASKLYARTVRGAMTAPTVTISETASIALAAKRMLEADVNRLPVVNGEALVGIVTRTDLVRAFARPDLEIEREVNDEILAGHLWLDTTVVRATVVDGNVTVEGRPSTRIDAELVERVVARVPGVVSVTVHR